MATSFGLVDVPVSTAGVGAAVTVVSQRNLSAVFNEVGASAASSQDLAQVAQKAGVKVQSLDPIELAPAPGTGAQSYFALMEQDLTDMEGPLDCDTTGSFS